MSRASSYREPVTVAELAAYLGVTPARIRQVVAEHGIRPKGHRWKANLYDAWEVIRHAGPHDRLQCRRCGGLHSSHGQVCPEQSGPASAATDRGPVNT